MRRITKTYLEEYREYLYSEEKAEQTIEKYMRDLDKLMQYADGRDITKELMIDYKKYLLYEKCYSVASINSYLVAANRFFSYMQWYGISVKTLRVQKVPFCPDEKELTKEDYSRLVKTARKEGKSRLSMLIQTICATGIRISELPFLTVESVRRGRMEVHNKGKVRMVILQDSLRKQLLIYIAKRGIKSGIVFCTKSGKPLNRSNIWREMQALCGTAKVKESKVFPHNLRHLFARTFYEIKKDIVKLADILGHSNIETTRIYLKTSIREYQIQLNQMGLVLKI